MSTNRTAIISDPSEMIVILNEKIGYVQDYIQNHIENTRKWINDILGQSISQSLDRKDRCEICNSKEEKESLELHHIAGRKHDFRTITTCINCHQHLSNMQKMWDARWWRENQSDTIRMAFFLCGLKDILYLKFQKTSNNSYQLLADKLVHEISKRLVG